MQSHHTNHRHASGVKYSPRNFIYLSTKNLTLPKGRAKKLQPKYIGLYKVVEAHTVALTVKLELLLSHLSAFVSYPLLHSLPKHTAPQKKKKKTTNL